MTRPTITSLVLFTALVCTNCSREKERVPINTLKDVMTNLAPASEQFEVDPGQETYLKGKKGTSVYIPADAFQFEDGTIPTSSINIELKECYSLTDMIGENLSTMSGPRILETGGMIYFNATAGGKQLSVKEGKAFVVSLPKGDQKNEMDLFYNVTLGDTLSTWVPDYLMYLVEQKQITQADSATEVSDGMDNVNSDNVNSVKYPTDLSEDLFDYQFGAVLIDGIFTQLPLSDRKGTILNYLEDPANIPDSVIKQFKRNNWIVQYEFNIDRRGKMINFKFLRDDHFISTAYAQKIVKQYLENAPAFNVTIDSIKVDHKRKYRLGVAGGKELNEGRYKKKFREQYSQYTNKAIQKMDKDALDFYAMSVTRMGWINCDRFWDIDDQEKTHFIVTTPEQHQDTKIQIVFKDIKSIMTPTSDEGNSVFESVPLGEAIRVIGISYSNGKPTMAVAETTVDKDGFELKDFKEFSIDELERELNQ